MAVIVLGTKRPSSSYRISPSADEGREAKNGELLTIEEGAAHQSPIRIDSSAPLPITQRGSLVVLTRGGRTIPNPWGRITCLIDSKGAQDELTLTIQDGKWSCEAREGAQLLFTNLTVDGRACDLELQSAVAHEKTPVELRARVCSSPLLHVIDRASGEELDKVTLVSSTQQAKEFSVAPPSSSRLVSEGLSSPIALPDSPGTLTYWVRAGGYAWKSVTICHQLGGDRCVAMDRVCTVDFVVKDAVVGNEYTIVVRYNDALEGSDVREPGSEVAMEISFAGGNASTTYHAEFPTGQWSSTVLNGGASSVASKTGRTRPTVFQTHAGVLLSVTLQCDPPPLDNPKVLSDLSIEVVGDEHLDLLSACYLRGRTLNSEVPISAHAKRSAMNVVPNNSGYSLLFDYGPIPVGEYELIMSPLQQVHQFFVAARPSSLEVVAFEPGHTWSIALLDASTRIPVQVTSAMWGPLHLDALVPAGVDAQTGRVELSSATNEIELLVWLAKGNAPLEIFPKLDAGLAIQEQLVGAPTSIRLQLTDQGSRVPMRSEWWDHVRVTGLDGSTIKCGVSMESNGGSVYAISALFVLPVPEIVNISLPPLVDYPGVPDTQVAVLQGQLKVVNIELGGGPCALNGPR